MPVVPPEEDGDEIGLWQIEKRVSFGLRRENFELEAGASGSASASASTDNWSETGKGATEKSGGRTTTVVSLGGRNLERY